MKIIQISIIYVISLIMIYSCKKNISYNNTVKPQKQSIRSQTFLDSLKYFSMTPAYFNEYYFGSKLKIENKKLMENAIKNSKYFTPKLTEKILDTTKTKYINGSNINYRVGDIAIELIDISTKENLQEFILQEFNEKDLKNINDMSLENIGFETRVYIPLFFNKDGSPNVHNRSRLYKLYLLCI